MQSKKIHVYGRVQGVWFRASTKKQAEALGLNGTVRNMPDGSVYIEVSGPEDKVTRFVDWCHHGPELARVDKVVTEDMALPEVKGFQILR